MKLPFPNPSATTQRRQADTARGFTLTELLFVIGMTALLATVLLSASFTTQERVLRAECASNLKQIGSATLIYAGENNDFVPIRSWHNPPPVGIGNPWQTYEVCRINGIGSRSIVEGPYGLGLLFFGKEVTDPKIFYCPSIKNGLFGLFAYDTYNEAGWPWPSIPPDFTDANPYVRSSYNYYAQPKATETISDGTYGVVTMPVLAAQNIVLTSPYPGDPPQSVASYPARLKTSDVDPTKAVACDVLQNMSNLSHKIAGQPGGVNALFGDGHVNWTPVRGNNKKGSLQPFDPRLWDPFTGVPIGNSPTAFRIIMNGLVP